VVHLQNGFVVPPGNPQALAQAIDVVRGDRAAAETMGRAGRQRVLERFRWEQVVERCLEAYAAS
jgi:glycosyltransferase involved in cell wall biosynthesis